MGAKLTVIIPGFEVDPSWSEALVMPHLDFLYGRCQPQRMSQNTLEIMQQVLQQSTMLPVAALRALGDNLKVGAEWWLCADPVHIATDHRHAYLLGNKALDLSHEEVESLVEEVSAFLSQDGLQLQAGNATHWYLTKKQPSKMETHALSQLMAASIANYLPTGEEQTYWRKLFTELQMLLHQSPVNQQRRRQGQPTVDALWFWGEGQLSTLSQALDFQWLCSNHVIAPGLAQWAALRQQDYTLELDSLITSQPEGHGLWLIDDLQQAKVLQDKILWHSLMRHLDHTLFKPMITAIQRGTLSQVQIYLPDYCHFLVNKKFLRRWWRRHRSIAL